MPLRKACTHQKTQLLQSCDASVCTDCVGVSSCRRVRSCALIRKYPASYVAQPSRLSRSFSVDRHSSLQIKCSKGGLHCPDSAVFVEQKQLEHLGPLRASSKMYCSETTCSRKVASRPASCMQSPQYLSAVGTCSVRATDVVLGWLPNIPQTALKFFLAKDLESGRTCR